MKLMAVLTAFVLCFASVPALVLAQEPDREEAREELRALLETSAERLQLTEEQKPLVEEILRESMEQRNSVFEKYGVTPGERPNLGMRQMRSMGGEMKDIRENTYERMGGVLNEEQLAEFRKIQDELRDEMRARMRARR